MEKKILCSYQSTFATLAAGDPMKPMSNATRGNRVRAELVVSEQVHRHSSLLCASILLKEMSREIHGFAAEVGRCQQRGILVNLRLAHV